MISFIQLFEQWIKDGDKDIYMLPTVMGAKDKRAEEVLELINWYCDKYKTDKSAIFVARRRTNEETLKLFNCDYKNIQPLIDKVISKLKVGNFAGSEKDDEIHNQFVYVFIKENYFKNPIDFIDNNGKLRHCKHLYLKFQFMYNGNSDKGLEFGKKNKAKIDVENMILKDISVHPTDSLTI